MDENKNVNVLKLILLLGRTILVYLSALFLITYLLENYASIVLIIIMILLMLFLIK